MASTPPPSGPLRALLLLGAALLPVLAMAAPAAGDPTDELSVAQGAETVVTASRLPEKASDSLAAVRVITAADLASRGADSLGEVLRQLGGVEVVSAGGPGQPTSVFMRGANSSHTLVLVDGLRLQSSTSGSTAFEHIPVSAIERIEIVPGPVSGLYGSDAIGGVIQIFTRSLAPRPETDISVGAGSYGTARLQAGTRGRADAFEYGVSLSALGSDAFPATNPQAYAYSPRRDDYWDRGLDASLGWHYAEGHALKLRMLQSVAATRFASGPGTDDVSHQTLSQTALSSEDRISGTWASELRFGVSRDSAFSQSYGTNETVQRELSWQNTFTLGSLGTLLAGLDDLNEGIQADPAGSTISVTSRDTRAGFLAYSASVGASSVRASLRHSDNAQFGGINTGTLAAGYRLDDGLKLRASYGSAFHAPSFNDLYISYPAPPFPYFSNPALRPERSHNAEVGADGEWSGTHVGLTAFDNEIEDLIVITSDFSTVNNLAQARIRGLELNADGPIARGHWDLRATFQQPVDRATGLRLPRRASRFATARLTQSWAAIDWSLEAQAFGARYDSTTEDPTTRMGGYGLFHLAAGHRFSEAWKAELRWTNLAGHRYALVPGYNVPGSSIFATLVWSQP